MTPLLNPPPPGRLKLGQAQPPPADLNLRNSVWEKMFGKPRKDNFIISFLDQNFDNFLKNLFGESRKENLLLHPSTKVLMIYQKFVLGNHVKKIFITSFLDQTFATIENFVKSFFDEKPFSGDGASAPRRDSIFISDLGFRRI